MNKDVLKLENQLCFPLYVASRNVIRRYKPLLDKYNLTYTQYIALMVLWEHDSINVKELGEKLYLDSGTLTPLLKNLESKGILKRVRLSSDERNLSISLTDKGKSLKDKLIDVPCEIGKCINISEEEAKSLYSILYKIINAEDIK